MGYTKILRYGDTIEIYNYEKNIDNTRRKGVSNKTRARSKKIREHAKSRGTYQKSKASILRSTHNFFRLCHHNNINARTIHFVTITFAYDLAYKTATRNVSEWFRRIKENYPEISLSYISVPELTKKGRYHFHLLVYDLPPETAERERETRNFQRLFQRGYIDISLASYTSKGLAGYMAKYMAKALYDFKNEAVRGYNCSRNIKKIYSAGGNSLSGYTDLIVPTDGIADLEESEYNVPYLGRCIKTKLTVK
jgi:hypothetical protein